MKPLKQIICVIFFLILASSSYAQGPASDKDYISALSYLLVEEDTWRIIDGRDYHRPLPPASTTKVLTTIIAIETLKGNEIIKPDRGVLKIPRSKLNLKPGKGYRAQELIKGTMIESANDAAYALATYIAGSEENFAALMNEKAKKLGAHHTNFRNASGLYAPDQFTTCYDLALIFRYALSNPVFTEIARTKYFFFNEGKKTIRYQNHNRFLFCFEPTIAGKTGYTSASRHSYVGAFERDGKTYILTILGSEDKWADAVKILKILYDKVPTDDELRLAKSSAFVLTSYKHTKPKKVVLKKSKLKLKAKKIKKAHKRHI
ncbi:MAG TPA: serine hydrolase [Syntrophorhabdaceae bacterium]|nr:serine hydrolase [Syntrophorhabdaceae bacterium]